MSISELGEQNPWWRDKALIESDTLVVAWERSSFRWWPRIVETFQWDARVIYSLRGPRQVGKTTLLRLKIRDLLKSGVDARRVFYWACDQVESFEKLSAIIATYLDWARRFSNEMLYLFLDEVSAVKDWQRGIKYLYDMGKLRNCLIVLTGSHSLDLVKATESLAGRRGEVDRLVDKVPDKIFLGAKFAEYVETRNEEILKVLRELRLLSTRERLNALLSLVCGEIPECLSELRLYQKDLDGLLDDYLLTGGIPRAINSYISRGNIPEIVYSDYVNLILRDIARWGGDEIFLRQIVQRIVQTMSSQVSWNSLKDETEISTHDTARWYVDILMSSFVVSYLHQLDKDKGVPYYKKAKKVYFRDPFIFHALKWWALGDKQPFIEALEFLEDPEEKSKLVESVVCDHLIRLLFNMDPNAQFNYATRLFYWESGKKREVDFVVKLGGDFLPIELKYQPKVRKSDVFGIIDFEKGGKSSKGIIITKDAWNEKRTHIEMPASVFLILP
ncbi:MAG: ATP-binding protein [Candidatus Methanomethyliaceae archaeon]|nr:ATP-binding protein [Candidatus Methanomethyliaceae archaeon]